MAAKRPRKITIELVPIRAKIDRAINQAKRSVARGKTKIAQATREKRPDDAAKNRAKLEKARRALANLQQAQRLMNESCCNQRYNCDPDYL